MQKLAILMHCVLKTVITMFKLFFVSICTSQATRARPAAVSCAQARYLRALLPLSAIILGRSHGQQLVACDDARSIIKMIHCNNLMIQITTNKVDIFIGPSAGTFCRVTFCRKLLAEGSKAPALAEGGRRSHPICEQPYIYIYIERERERHTRVVQFKHVS